MSVLAGVGVEAVVCDEVAEGEIDFADEDGVAVCIGGEDGAHFCDDLMGLGAVGGVEGVNAAECGVAFAPFLVEWIVTELVVLDEEPEYVHAEAVYSSIEPEAHGGVDGIAYLRVTPVKVWLLAQEGVVVELLGPGVVGPGISAEVRLPVVGWA